MELTDVISPRLVGRVQQAANETEGVLRSDDIKMRRVGSEIFVEATIALPSEISFESAHEISANVEDNIARSLSGSGMHVKPRNITVHFEPVVGVDMPPELVIQRGSISSERSQRSAQRHYFKNRQHPFNERITSHSGQ